MLCSYALCSFALLTSSIGRCQRGHHVKGLAARPCACRQWLEKAEIDKTQNLIIVSKFDAESNSSL
jgi:hypothetical protein